MIRECDAKDHDEIREVINDAAAAYRGVVPADCCHDPYMSRDELAREIEAGVAFFVDNDEAGLAAVMGLQLVGDVALIRHAYTRTACQGQGRGRSLLGHLRRRTACPILVGTWKAAAGAVRFYERHGFRRIPDAETPGVLRRYWTVPERQIAESIVLADDRWWAARAGLPIRTRRLDLVAASADLLQAELDGPPSLGASLRCQVPATWPPDLYDEQATRYSLRAVEADPANVAWNMYYVVRRPTHGIGVLVGVGGFKGPPDENGAVEIGYGIVADHRRQGYATEAAEGWVQFAFARPQVTKVVAHTLATLIPSIGVLTKLGFRYVGVGSDPDVPPGETVVRYELTR